MRSFIGPLMALLALSAGGRAEAYGERRIAFVTDLADVAGCRFIGTVRGPALALGSRDPNAYQGFYGAIEQHALLRGATHVYILNRSGGWGGVAAFGVAYACDGRG